jgi:hypothetical protein
MKKKFEIKIIFDASEEYNDELAETIDYYEGYDKDISIEDIKYEIDETFGNPKFQKRLIDIYVPYYIEQKIEYQKDGKYEIIFSPYYELINDLDKDAQKYYMVEIDDWICQLSEEYECYIRYEGDKEWIDASTIPTIIVGFTNADDEDTTIRPWGVETPKEGTFKAWRKKKEEGDE